MAAETLRLGEVQRKLRTVWMHLASFNSLQCLRSLCNSSCMWKHSKGSEQVEYSSVLFQTCTVRSDSVLPLPSNLQVPRSTIFSPVVNCVSEYIPSSTSSSQDQLQQMEGGHQQRTWNKITQSQWLKYFLPLAIRLTNIFLPETLLFRARNPCLRFLTR